VYCGAFKSSVTPTSVADIKNAGFYTIANAGGVQNISISGLEADTTYNIYCTTLDFASRAMPYSVALLTKTVASTSCCRAIVFPSIPRLAEVSSRNPNPYIFSFSVNSKPITTMNISLSLVPSVCNASYGIFNVSSAQQTLTTLSPSVVTLTSESTSLSEEFSIQGYQGCYTLYAIANTASGEVYQSASAEIVIVSVQYPPDAPVLLSVEFARDASIIYFTYSSATNRPPVDGTTSFTCSELTAFSGSDFASCMWINSTTMSASLANVPTDSKPVSESLVHISDRKVKAECVPDGYDCNKYPFTSNTTMEISTPVGAVAPKISMATSASIGSCDDIYIDLTGTVGALSRPWRSFQWSVDGNNSIITNYLNDNYQNIQTIVKIPNRFLQTNTLYTFKLSATNVFGLVGTSQASVFVELIPAVIPVTLTGPPAAVVYRYQTLNYLALASFPSCLNNTSNFALKYSWKLYSGVTYLPSIQSQSNDERKFLILPYTLDAGKQYVLQVIVTSLRSSSSNVVSAATSTIVVGQSNIEAKISGGSTQSWSSLNTIKLYASSSYSVDYPLTPLKYSWACTRYNPSFGTSCGIENFLASMNTSALFIPPGVLPSNSSYSLSVTVQDDSGNTASTSVIIAIIESATPEISIGSVLQKYNAQQSIILSGSVTTVRAATVSWSVDDINSTSLATRTSSPITQNLNTGSFVIQLGFLPYALVPGQSYVLRFTAKYPDSTRSATASVTVTINIPPSSGILDVSPTTGAALNTTFFMNTHHWTDNPDDYPLTYTMAYYDLDVSNLNIVKSSSILPYASVYFGPGLASMNYKIFSTVIASDIFGGTANRTVNVTVVPVGLSRSLLTSKLDSAFISKDPSAVVQVVTAATTIINTVNCTVPISCALINRASCKATTKTCGKCLIGFLGASGDSNLPCAKPTKILRTGAACTALSSCIAGPCVDGKCIVADKTCPGNCNSNGKCLFYSHLSGLNITSCGVTNSSCKAECKCNPGYSGSDCSVSLAESTELTSIRGSLCSAILNASYSQDLNSDVIVARVSTVANVLSQSSQLSSSAIDNCRSALVSAITSKPDLAGAPNASTTAINALSNVLVSDPSSVGLVTSTLTTLSVGMQTTIASGSPPTTVISGSIRLTSSVSLSGNKSICLSIPQTDAELVDDAKPVTSCSDSTSSGALSTTLIQFDSNPRGINTPATSLQTISFAYDLTDSSVTQATGRRLSLPTSPLGMTVVLQNPHKVDYINIPPIETTYECLLADKPLNFTGICPDGYTRYNVTCPGTYTKQYNVTCPGHYSFPKCAMWNGESYEVNPSCKVVEYTAYNTTCYCPPTTSDLPSILKPFARHSEFGTYASASSSIEIELNTVTSFRESLLSITYVDNVLPLVEANATIIGILSGIVSFMIVGLFLFIYSDRKDMLTGLKHKATKSNAVRTVAGFFDALLPNEFRDDKKWFELLTMRFSLEHTWLRLVRPFRPERDYRSVQWLLALGNILIYCFLDTLAVFLLYPDTGHCQTFKRKPECSAYQNSLKIGHVCQWDPDTNYCLFKSPREDILTIVLITSLVVVAALPMEYALSFMVRVLSEYARQVRRPVNKTIFNAVSPTDKDSEPKFNKKVFKPDDEYTHTSDEFWRVDDELRYSECRLAKFYKAARLMKLQESCDYSMPSEEVDLLLSQSELDHRNYGNRNIVLPDDSSAKLREIQRHLTYTARHSRYANIASSKRSFIKRIEHVRERADWIKNEMELMNTDAEREYFLMREFISYNFTGYQRAIAKRYILGIYENSRFGRLRRGQRFLCAIALPSILVVMAYMVYHMSKHIGSEAVHIWIVIILSSIFQDIVLVQPMRIWLRWQIVNDRVSKEAKMIIDSLSLRFYSIINRTKGTIRDSNSMIQHLNPACRAARMFPGLPASRFLLSVNDFDVPYFRVKAKPSYILTRMRNGISWFIQLFPIQWQDLLIDFSLTAFLCILGLAFILLGYENMIAGILVALFCIAVFILFEMQYLKPKKISETFKSLLHGRTNKVAVATPVSGVFDDEVDKKKQEEESKDKYAASSIRKRGVLENTVDDYHFFEMGDDGFIKLKEQHHLTSDDRGMSLGPDHLNISRDVEEEDDMLGNYLHQRLYKSRRKLRKYRLKKIIQASNVVAAFKKPTAEKSSPLKTKKLAPASPKGFKSIAMNLKESLDSQDPTAAVCLSPSEKASAATVAPSIGNMKNDTILQSMRRKKKIKKNENNASFGFGPGGQSLGFQSSIATTTNSTSLSHMFVNDDIPQDFFADLDELIGDGPHSPTPMDPARRRTKTTNA
jgi:hypothetical protein